jgi:lambda repressor-like predicted transcriptional regulator
MAQTQCAALLKATGLSLREISEALGINVNAVSRALRAPEAQDIVAAIREVAKQEIVANALQMQRNILEGALTMPVDRDHAGAHSQLATALKTHYMTAAHAAGEATERTEAKVLSLTLDERKDALKKLHESRGRKASREKEAAAKAVQVV